VALAELGAQTLILRQRSSQTRIWLDNILQQHGVHPHIGAEFDNVESIKRAVANGAGVTILPAYAAEQEAESGRLRLLHVADVPLQRTLKLLWNRETYASPVVTAFLHCLRRCLPELDVQQIVV
jgi:DNA-binding transcriptional LysR family regulator